MQDLICGCSAYTALIKPMDGYIHPALRACRLWLSPFAAVPEQSIVVRSGRNMLEDKYMVNLEQQRDVLDVIPAKYPTPPP